MRDPAMIHALEQEFLKAAIREMPRPLRIGAAERIVAWAHSMALVADQLADEPDPAHPG